LIELAEALKILPLSQTIAVVICPDGLNLEPDRVQYERFAGFK